MSELGWYGIRFQHPDDWAPVVVSGDRRAGYLRLASPKHLSLQVRWAIGGSESLVKALDRYLDRLSKDSRRSKVEFSRESNAESFGLSYRYRGQTDGDGVLFVTPDKRVIFLESIGDSTTARQKILKEAFSSFRSGVLPELWSVFGISFSLPGSLKVESKEFVAGRTTLKLSGTGVHVTAERWGLASSLFAQSSFRGWTEARLGSGWTLNEVACGLEATKKTLLGTEHALVQSQPDLNQITLIRVRTRKSEWRPNWDWLT